MGHWAIGPSAVSDSARHVFGHSKRGVSDAIFDNDDNDDSRQLAHMASIQAVDGELMLTVFDAVRCLPTSKQAAILLDASLELIEAGQCGVLWLFSQDLAHFSADMETRSKVSLRFISRLLGYRKRT